MPIDPILELIAQLQTRCEKLEGRIAKLEDPEFTELRVKCDRLKKADQEAAIHVESVICTRTHFTGNPPYVGWQGLGLALNEVLDHRQELVKLLEEIVSAAGTQHHHSGNRDYSCKLCCKLFEANKILQRGVKERGTKA
jgi:hypothetical protein